MKDEQQSTAREEQANDDASSPKDDERDKSREQETKDVEPAARTGFPVVGIGASAGGLEAFQKFFSALPDDPGMAFVLIQHLDPNHDSMMPDLLSRHTGLDVVQVKERMPVEENTVYIIPPGKYLGLEADHLVLSEPPKSRGQRMAIDHFFQTLAEIRLEKAVCIVLSGTGSDGTQGLREVKASGGLALVQDPDTAQHEGMPRSAISTGAVDRILAPSEMPEVLLEYAKHPYVNGRDKEKGGEVPAKADQLEDILSVLYAKTGHEFKHYKKNTLGRRIQRRMSLNHIVKTEEYLSYLRKDQQEAEELFKDLLINVTGFFREPEAWQELERHVIPELVKCCDGEHPIRVWTPGCASGEEAYSIAILLYEALEKSEKRCEVQIYGTDIDKDAFQIARAGRYPESIAASVSQERLERFFDREESFYVVKKFLRESVVFAPQSLITDPPFSNLDLVICRNLLIYLEPETQSKIIRLFHFALKEDSFLFLGASETTGNQNDLFEPVSKKWRVYKRLGGRRPTQIELPVFRAYRGKAKKDGKDVQTGRKNRVMSPASITQEALVKHYAPPAVLIDRNFDVLFFQGDTAKFLKQPEGEPTQNLLEQAAAGLRTRLRWLLQHVIENDEHYSVEHGFIVEPDGSRQSVTMEAKPLKRPTEAKGLILVTFLARPAQTLAAEEKKPAPQGEETDDSTVQQLEYELKVTQEELQSTIEEMETSNEELKASNEEVMSMNEELQSTNEELETSKEELQSLNEELTTVNNELREKVRELEEANDDMANLLESTHIPTLFLDRELRIKRFTPSATEVMHLVSSDTGRQLDHIGKRFEDAHLLEDIRNVLKDLSVREREIRTDEDRWYTRRIFPYRTQDDRIAGVVITFVDITQRKKHLEEIKAREDQLRGAIVNAPLPVILFAEDEEILLVSRTWTEITGYRADELKTLSQWTEKAYGSRKEEVRDHIRKVLEAEKRIDEGEFTVRTKEGADRIWHFHSSPLGSVPDGRRMIVAMAIDITARRAYEKALSEKEEELRQMNVDLERTVNERTRKLEEKSREIRRMAIELSQTEQRERRRLASTLHDNLQQIIASARLRLETSMNSSEQADQEGLSQVQKLLQEAADTCRNVTSRLAPPVLYDAGFFSALRWLCKDFKENHDLLLSCDIAKYDAEPFDQDTAVFVFQSIKELLFNIVKHAGVDHARLSVGMKDGYLDVAISDTGKGFDMKQLDADSREKGGYGLFSIRQRMAVVGGYLEIDSEPGKGTRVEISVPVEQQEGQAESGLAAASESPPKEEDDSGVRVLLADDHHIFREGLRSLLEGKSGISVVGEAADGAEAVERAHELKPDVILMDINMPRMNGIEATRKLAGKLPHTRIIGLSVNSREDMAESMHKAGAAAYLPKGGPSAELLAEIRKDRPSDSESGE
jgi:two-component system CheB/CheR fusion protein